ncbi:MAG: hypothetical protein ACR2KT_12395 [Methylocella sp.]
MKTQPWQIPIAVLESEAVTTASIRCAKNDIAKVRRIIKNDRRFDAMAVEASGNGSVFL